MPPLRPPLILRFLFHFLPWLLHLSVANTLLSLLLPVSLLSPTAAYNASSLIAASVWQHIQHIFTRVNDADILITGDTLPAGESAIVVSNHVEWSDFYLIQALALRAGMLGRCRWFAKKELKWVPFLGWGLWAMGMPLVSRRWMDDKREMDRVFDGVVERKWPICSYNPIPYNPSHPVYFPTKIHDPARIRGASQSSHYEQNMGHITNVHHKGLISFSESTRLTPEKRLLAAQHASKTNKPLPNHLLLPRTKGFAACVSHLRNAPHVKAVYDVTVAYAERSEQSEVVPERSKASKDSKPTTNGTNLNPKSSLSSSSYKFQTPPTFLQSLLHPTISSRWKTLVHVRRFEMQDLPASEEGLRLCLEERWVEKGELLESLRLKLERGEEWGWEGAKGK